MIGASLLLVCSGVGATLLVQSLAPKPTRERPVESAALEGRLAKLERELRAFEAGRLEGLSSMPVEARFTRATGGDPEPAQEDSSSSSVENAALASSPATALEADDEFYESLERRFDAEIPDSPWAIDTEETLWDSFDRSSLLSESRLEDVVCAASICFADVRFSEARLAGDGGGEVQRVMGWLQQQPCAFHIPDVRLADTSNPWDGNPGQRVYIDCSN